VLGHVVVCMPGSAGTVDVHAALKHYALPSRLLCKIGRMDPQIIKCRDNHLGQMLYVIGLRSWHGIPIQSHVQGNRSLERAMMW